MKQCCVKDDKKLFCDRAINCNTTSCYFKEGWVRALPFICCIFSSYLLFQALGIALSLGLLMCISSNKTESLGRGGSRGFARTPLLASNRYATYLFLFGSSSLASGPLEWKIETKLETEIGNENEWIITLWSCFSLVLSFKFTYSVQLTSAPLQQAMMQSSVAQFERVWAWD